MHTVTLQPISMVVLQGTSFCNLNCTYCDLSPESRRIASRMDANLIERVFRQVFESGRAAPQLTIVWHSGEPLTLPPAYYDDAIERIRYLRDTIVGEAVSLKFDFQTNGVLIDDEWCEFFLRHKQCLHLGVSCDGPPDMHDRYRVNWAGRSTADKTLRGMDLLQRYGISYNVIAVVTRHTLDHPERFFQFFLDRSVHLTGFHFNVLAGAHSPDPDLSYFAEDRTLYYSFYRRLLDLCQRASQAGSELKIRNFSHTLSRIISSQQTDAPRYIESGSAPLKSINVDTDGNITTFYAGLSMNTLPDVYGDGRGFSLGNINEATLETMVRSDKFGQMLQDFQSCVGHCEKSCEYAPVCPGGFHITQRESFGQFVGGETTECAIHVKALVDAVLDDITEHVGRETQGRSTDCPNN